MLKRLGLAFQAEQDAEGAEEDGAFAAQGEVAEGFKVDGHFGGEDFFDVDAVGVGGGSEEAVLVFVAEAGFGAEAGREEEGGPHFGTVVFDVAGNFGAGADEGHVAAEDVPELGDFIEAKAAEAAADAGDAPVVAGGDEAAFAIGMDAHAAEFVDLEGATALGEAGLGVEDRPGAVEADGKGDHEAGEGEEDEEDEAGDDVKETLEEEGRPLPTELFGIGSDGRVLELGGVEFFFLHAVSSGAATWVRSGGGFAHVCEIV